MTATWTCALVFLLAPAVHATLTIAKRDGFDLNWYFHNTSTKYTNMNRNIGYYRDYNGDGLLDFFFILSDPANDDWRLFTLNTAPTGGLKTYPTHKTAGRDIAAQPGVFVPHVFWTPRAPSMDYADLVVVGTNQPANQNYYTKYIFWRLNKNNTAFPTEATWEIDVVSTHTPVLTWANVSFNSDDYPDFLIYNSTPNDSNQFVIAFYDGRNGTPIWSRTLNLDPADPGTGILFPGQARCTPRLTVYPLPENAYGNARGDFDNNGKPEISCFYTFGRGDFTSCSVLANITLLNSSGNFLSPYSSTWTRIYQASAAFYEPAPVVAADDNKDGYVDLRLLNVIITATPWPAVFEGYNLKNRRSQFKSIGGDFGAATDDLSGFLVSDAWTYSPLAPGDVNSDTWNDLVVYRTHGFGSLQPLRVGMFNAYDGNGSQKGRKMWLTQFNSYNRAYANVNDFNGDNLCDYLLVRDPDEPDSPTVGSVTWRLANTAVSASGITLGRQFDYVAPHSFSWNPAQDDFQAYSVMFYPLLDVDGDGQHDTCGQMACAFDDGRNNTWDLSYGYVFIYDNPPGTSPPPLTADFQVKVQNEDWIPAPYLYYAVDAQGNVFVDNNRDGYWNDVIIDTEKAVFSLSFTYRVLPDLPGQTTNPYPPDGSRVSPDVILRWAPADDAISYNVYLGTSAAAVQNASTTSPEYKGNQAGVSCDPPTLPCAAIYYWRVDSKNARGVTKGNVWSFRAICTDASDWQGYR